MAVCDAVSRAWNGSGETITAVAARFGMSRAWIHKNVYPALQHRGRNPGITVQTFNTIPNHRLNSMVIISATALITITTPIVAMMTPTGPSITLINRFVCRQR